MRQCIICGENEKIKAVKTRVSGFLAERMFGAARIDTEFLHCKSCGFAFYALRPDDVAMAKFYEGYRGEAYQAQRQSHERWYTKKVNGLITKNEKEIWARAENMEKIIKDHIYLPSVKNVLDYGGDSGQYIPAVFADAAKYVYDISGAAAVKGVNAVAEAAGLTPRGYDFVMCCHTLEHVSDPAALIKDLKNLCAPGGWLYLELPFDSPFCRKKGFYFQVLKSGVFSLRAIFEKFLQSLRYPFLMNEHINFFTPDSAEILLNKYGFKIAHISCPQLDFGWIKDNIISILAKAED